jgi:phage shock protein A
MPATATTSEEELRARVRDLQTRIADAETLLAWLRERLDAAEDALALVDPSIGAQETDHCG